MRVKETVRDLRWRLRGEVAQNPPLPQRIDSLLFVCLGNICRSPFAGLLAQQRLTEIRVVGTVARSAGIKTTQSGHPPLEACEAARAYGISLESHRPVLLTADLMRAHDLVVVMELQQLDHLRSVYTELASRIVLLSLFDPDATGYDRYNIEDPFMRPPAVFAACYRRIDRAVTALCTAIRGRTLTVNLPRIPSGRRLGDQAASPQEVMQLKQ
jgi:protein-tyrosine phosphatase